MEYVISGNKAYKVGRKFYGDLETVSLTVKSPLRDNKTWELVLIRSDICEDDFLNHLAHSETNYKVYRLSTNRLEFIPIDLHGRKCENYAIMPSHGSEKFMGVSID